MSVQVNGQALPVEAGDTILELLERAGIHVPHLCYDPRLAPIGACRLCVIAVRGSPYPVTACTTAATDGMQIETHGAEVEAERRGLLALLARHYPPISVGESEDNPLLVELRAYGLAGRLLGRRAWARDTAHPYIDVDMSRCIYCYRCQRICDDLQGQFTWTVRQRGFETRVVPDSGTTLLASSCVSCGACADTCPSGAIEDKSLSMLGPPASWTRTTCPYCGVGCEMQVGTRAGRLVQVLPVLDAPVSKGHLCVKGRYAFGFEHSGDRLISPMIRGAAGWSNVSWEQAIEHVSRRLRAIRAAHGADSVGVLGSARATNEDNYLAQKLARVALGTHNVDCCARVCHAPSAAALGAVLGAGAATNSFDDIEAAGALLILGSNATENHPIVGARIRQAARRGARLLVIDPRHIELARIADVHLQLRTGTNVPLLHGMAAAIIEAGLVDGAFLAARVDGYHSFRQWVAAWPPERAAAACGVDAELIRRAAREYATARPAMCFHGLGLTEHAQGTETVMCLINLALLTGNIGVVGGGVNPLRGQNNVQGAAHMGCEPRHLTGSADIEAARALFERVWGARLPTTRGLDLMEMMDAALAGSFKALLAIGYDVLLTNPRADRTRAALSRLELLVVQDLFMSETARELATVILPCASSFEKDGTFMNSERRVQRVRQVLPPPGEARPDWQIACMLARALGYGDRFGFQSAEEIWQEVRAVWPAGAGISYARLERGGLQWPCPSDDHPGTRVLHTPAAAAGRRARLREIDYAPTAEVCSAEYPLLLITGRKLYQFNAGTMTGRTPNTLLQPADVLEVSVADAAQHRLASGDRVVVRSRYGATTLPVQVSATLRAGELFATFHTTQAFINRVTGGARDAVTHTPEYKVTAVCLESVAD